MVVLHVKRSDKDSFLVETSVTESNDELIRRLASRCHIVLVFGLVFDSSNHNAKFECVYKNLCWDDRNIETFKILGLINGVLLNLSGAHLEYEITHHGTSGSD